MNDLFFYTVAKDLFYEKFEEKVISEEFLRAVKDKIDQNWSIIKTGIYFNVSRNKMLPSQGWKIHVSTTIEDAEEILDITSNILIANRTPFKFLLDKNTLIMTSQKGYNRAAFGKFITIYPKDESEFTDILEKLYIQLKGFSGPYVLSDRRYKDCKVLYYRYGGFLKNYELDDDGSHTFYIYNGHGRKVEDKRLPYYTCPDGIFEIVPFVEPSQDSKLFKNYEIKEVIQFSNAGGIYLGKSRGNNNIVVIKEARPHTVLIDIGKDAIFLRRKEEIILKKFGWTGFVPKIYDSYMDWEHFYLIEEYIEGQTLNKFVVQNNPIPRNGSENQVTEYFKRIIEIFISITEFIRILHSNNYIFADFSLDNIMIDNNSTIKFIDMEGCFERGDLSHSIGTPGFSEKISLENLYESDIYSLGCLLFSCILKKNNMIHLKIDTVQVFLSSVWEDYSLPEQLKVLILNMIQADYLSRPNIEEVQLLLKEVYIGLKTNQVSKKRTKEIKKNQKVQAKLDEVIQQGLSAILSSKNETSLATYPNTPLLNNDINISNGLSGIVMGMNYLGVKSLNAEFIKTCKNINENEPLGLYVGISGALWTLLEIEEIEIAEKLFVKHFNYERVKDNHSIYSGLSGLGLLCLKFYHTTKNNKYLNIAIIIGDIVKDKLEVEDIGYKKGSSGVALFLLYLSIASKNDNYLALGRKFLMADLQKKVTYNHFDTIDFPSRQNSQIASPYFLEGTSGILATLLRYYKVTNEKLLKEQSIELADSLTSKYAISPTLFKGTSGIGNTLIDCFQILKKDKYQEIAYQLAESCLLHKIKYKNGVLFPDLYINKLSSDFGYGTIGILMFLKRLRENNSSNFCLFIDELL